MKKHNVPVVQIDEAMMEKAVETGGKILIVATHGPTVKSTQALLEEAFDLLGKGDIEGHNEVIARAIREK